MCIRDSSDGDGVKDKIDECPDTPSGTPVNFKGCPIFFLPLDNNKVEVTSATCIGNTDGSIGLSVEDNSYDYSITVTGKEDPIVITGENKTASVTGLAKGTYTVCFKVDGQSDYEQCFDVVVGEPEKLNAFVSVDEDDKKIGDYKESRVSLQPTTRFLHNEDKGAGYGIDVSQDGIKLAQGESQVNQVTNGTALTMVVKGQSYLEAGDLIKFNMLAVDEKNPTLFDPQYSGKYIITKVRHQVNSRKYTMALECAKDSVKQGYSKKNFKIPANRNIPTLRNSYEDESYT